MNENGFCPAVFFSHSDVELALEVVFAFAKNDDLFSPTNFSNQWLEIFDVPVFQVELTHIPKVLHRKPLDSPEPRLQLNRELFHDGFAPAEGLLFFYNGLSNGPIKVNQLTVYGPKRFVLRFPDFGFDVRDEFGERFKSA